MNEPGYRQIIEALDGGRRALARARLTAGLLRFLGIAMTTVAGLVLWAVLMHGLRFYSVPVAAAASILGVGVVVFALIRWILVPLVRLPGREAFVALVERRFPREKNLIVNAYQLGEAGRTPQAGRAPDLVDALIARASARVRELDLRRWRDPAPDRPYLWAGGGAIAVMAVLGLASPALLTGALGQVVRPSRAQAPPVSLTVTPGDVEVDRGSDVAILVAVDGTGRAPALQFREHGGEWRVRDFGPHAPDAVNRDGGLWDTVLPRVDRNLEYRVEAPRAQSRVFAITVREPPRLAGFRTHLTYPAYSGLGNETLNSGSGDVAALKGTDVDLRVLTNRPMAKAWLEWRDDRDGESRRVELESADGTTWKTEFRLMQPASYAVVLGDDQGGERLRSPRYRVDPVADRAPYLTLHYPQDDHDLTEDMMERIVADAADDYGFSSARVIYKVDDGPEHYTGFHPFTEGQKEFRLDTLWDLKGLDLLPGSVLTYYVEVKDNDTVSGPKAARSPVRRVRFPTVAELYADVADDHKREIGSLSDLHKEQSSLREKLEKLQNELKQGKQMDWDVRQDVQKSVEQQKSLEQQLSEVVSRLQETVAKASDRAQMNPDLVQKMAQINDLLQGLNNEDLKKSFQELSKALEKMDRNAVRNALEKLQANQDEMLKGLDRTIELLKQIHRDEQVEDVVRRTDEIAKLQDEIAKELEKMGAKRPKPAAEPPAGAQEQNPDRKAGDQEKTSEPNEKGDEKSLDKKDQAAGKDEASKKDEQSADKDQKGEQNPNGEENQEGAQAQKDQEAQKDQKGGKSQEGQKTPENRQDQNSQQMQEGRENQGNQDSQKALEDLKKSLEELRDQLAKKNQEQKGGQQKESQGNQENQKQNSQNQQERLEQLAEQQEQALKQLQDLKRRLETLQKMNKDQPQNSLDKMSEMQKSKLMRDLEKNMQQARQGMSQGQPQPAADFAFRARDEAAGLADMAKSMQQQMQEQMTDNTIQRMEKIIRNLIDVSQDQELLTQDTGAESRLQAQRQFDLSGVTQALADSLDAVAKQSLAIKNTQQQKLGQALQKMDRASQLYEQGNSQGAEFQGRESASDLNEAIVALMKSHAQMCSGSSGGQKKQQMKEQLQGLSESQEQLNRATRQMLERLQGKGRLSMTEEQRLQQMAAQQEMIRKGLEEMQQNFDETKDLLGDVDQLQKEMEDVQKDLAEKHVDPRLMERQQKILSRLLDAQRSIRQQEMSPQRESKTATLAERRSPPPIPEELLKKDRTLEEDVLRGSDDRYPAQYRKLVEEYFRALSKETRHP
jgi:hypothetical protein